MSQLEDLVGLFEKREDLLITSDPLMALPTFLHLIPQSIIWDNIPLFFTSVPNLVNRNIFKRVHYYSLNFEYDRMDDI